MKKSLIFKAYLILLNMSSSYSRKRIITDDDDEDKDDTLSHVSQSSKTSQKIKVEKNTKIVDDDNGDDSDIEISKGDCEICCETKLSLVCCPYCSYSSCELCYQRVILTSVTKPSCVSCKKQFNDDFFFQNFSDSFVKKKYKKHREQILFKMEESLLPETQPFVERLNKQNKLKDELFEIQIQMKELKEKQKRIKDQITELNRNDYEVLDEKEDKIVVCPCPSNDCRGFLNSKYKCGICGVKACRECREIKEKEHKCNPDTVKTVEELKKNCRNCPNCMISIYKISGCDQMFCVKCKVAFNWISGKIETGLVHNPHYFEWIKENGGVVPRNPHARECGGLPEYENVFSVIRDLNDFQYNTVGDRYRNMLHIQEITLRDLPTVMDNNSNRDLRIEYLMKKIEKEDFMKKLQKRDHDKTKFIEYRFIIEMYYNVSKDLLSKFIQDCSENHLYSQNAEKFIDEEVKIRQYSNECIEKLKKKYGSRSIYSLT